MNRSNENLLPKQAVRDTVAPVSEGNLNDYRSLLDRARLHLILASKALGRQDTVGAFRECEMTAAHLERAGDFIEAEKDSLFARLSRNLAGLYKQCSAGIPSGNFDLPAVALRGIFGESIKADTTDLSKLIFTAPPPTTIPLPLNEQVERNIVYFTTRARGTMSRWLERSGRFFPVMKPILKEEGVPDELIFLSMIESGLNPSARSPAKCVGLWQFLKSTGERYGLKGDWFFDDRRNPEKATRAAARHLQDLYNKYHDWHLALASYNCGSGRVDRAINASRLPNPTYWDILPYLPTETQNYVPIFIATAIIALNPEAYDFVHIDYLDPLQYEPYPISRSYQVRELADCAGVSLDEFVEMNPHILQSYTPAGFDNFEVRIPKGARSQFAEKLKTIQEVDFAEKGLHRVTRGETLSKVAKRYHVTLASLKSANDLKKTRALKPGEMLYIPKAHPASERNLTAIDNVKSNSARTVAENPLRNTRGRRQTTVTVEKGMTLGKLASKYECSVADIMTWNSMKSGDVLKNGQILQVWVRPNDGAPRTDQVAVTAPAPIPSLPLVQARAASRSADETTSSHRVRRGETLAGIAAMFNVTIDNLMAWNNLRDQNVRSGRVLKIRPAQGSVAGRPLYDSSKAVVETPAQKPAADKARKSDARTHTVQQGETLWGISTTYDVSPEQIRKWNNLRGDNIRAGQTLSLQPPDTRQSRSAKKERATTGRQRPKFHAVQDGEGLWSIAQRYGLSVDSLIIWNNLETTVLPAGLELALAAPTTDLTTDDGKPAAAATPETHTVTRKDRLPAIAKRYGLSVDALRAWNDIKGNDIREGQVLRLRKPASPSVQKKSSVRVQKSEELVPKSYMVESGETLYGIAKKLGVKVEDLQTWNKIQTNIRAGQTLTYYETP